MNIFNLNKPIYFIGIGGISMSGIAELLLDKGYTVLGSDLKKSHVTDRLEFLGIKVFYGQEVSHITPDIGLVVYTAAIKEDNPDFIRAKELNIPMTDRATCLGNIMKGYKNTVAVAGTHGKTTTTSMLSYVYLEAKLDPTISVGGMLSGIHGNMRLGKSENFIIEACEYENSFLHFPSTTAVVLNIEPEHLDFFKDLNDERNSFSKFIDLLPENGLLVINNDIKNRDELIKNHKINIVTYGLHHENGNSPKYSACNITYSDLGYPGYDLYIYNNFAARIELSVVGEHNVSNSLAVIAASHEPSVYSDAISLDIIKKGLKNYKGVERRFQYKGELNGVTIIDDYAHHPSEIRATLLAAEKVPHKRLVVAFQPHLYSRTQQFLNEFADVLSLADVVVLAEIYAAREKNPGNVSSKDIRNILVKNGHEAYYFETFKKIEDFLIHNLCEGDLLITMGAGDIVNVGEELLK